ncbi:hypothetical protein F4775DRAFT_533656 [Biscogniauxia sp. FL1348]|nr:hypothetical protein F4775DRAFT_533656 [Biscogniauxia sp. FL1348]
MLLAVFFSFFLSVFYLPAFPSYLPNLRHYSNLPTHWYLLSTYVLSVYQTYVYLFPVPCKTKTYLTCKSRAKANPLIEGGREKKKKQIKPNQPLFTID